jgi:uncharacterized membrane protein YdbT with pleckstrin-like domain
VAAVPATPPVLSRRISARAFAGLHAVLVIAAFVVWAAGLTLLPDVRPWIVVLVGLAPLAVGLVYTWLVRISTEYRVHRDSLEVESGLLSRRVDNVQMFRIRDLGLSQSLLARVLGVGDVTLTSTDRTSPRLVLRGVAGPREVYDTLRDLVARSQATRRTMIVEDDEPVEEH